MVQIVCCEVCVICQRYHIVKWHQYLISLYWTMKSFLSKVKIILGFRYWVIVFLLICGIKFLWPAPKNTRHLNETGHHSILLYIHFCWKSCHDMISLRYYFFKIQSAKWMILRKLYWHFCFTFVEFDLLYSRTYFINTNLIMLYLIMHLQYCHFYINITQIVQGNILCFSHCILHPNKKVQI